MLNFGCRPYFCPHFWCFCIFQFDRRYLIESSIDLSIIKFFYILLPKIPIFCTSNHIQHLHSHFLHFRLFINHTLFQQIAHLRYLILFLHFYFIVYPRL